MGLTGKYDFRMIYMMVMIITQYNHGHSQKSPSYFSIIIARSSSRSSRSASSKSGFGLCSRDQDE